MTDPFLVILNRLKLQQKQAITFKYTTNLNKPRTNFLLNAGKTCDG